MKTITADKLKKLPPGTEVYMVKDATGERCLMVVRQSYRKKIIAGAIAEMAIKDRPGWHYEIA